MPRRFATVRFKAGSSGSFLHFARADTRRANTHLLPHARHNRAQALQVRIPPAPPRVICVADHISIMRRFAAEFTLQCHISSCFSFYLGLDFLLEMSPNQAPHSSRPSISVKVRLLYPGSFFGTRVLRRQGFARRGLCIPRGSSGYFHLSLDLPPPCSYVRDCNARRVPVTPPIVLKLQGLAARRRASGRPYHCWPRSSHLICQL